VAVRGNYLGIERAGSPFVKVAIVKKPPLRMVALEISRWKTSKRHSIYLFISVASETFPIEVLPFFITYFQQYLPYQQKRIYG
jgi:hypothetical protein